MRQSRFQVVEGWRKESLDPKPGEASTCVRPAFQTGEPPPFPQPIPPAAPAQTDSAEGFLQSQGKGTVGCDQYGSWYLIGPREDTDSQRSER